MSLEVTAALYGAIFGALFGAIANGTIEIIKYLSSRKSQLKSIKIGLFYEINSHKIVEHEDEEEKPENEKRPIFWIHAFKDSFYKSNLSYITKTLDENLLKKISFYYTHMTIALSNQGELELTKDKINKISEKPTLTEKDVAESRVLLKRLESQKKLSRYLIAPSLHISESILENLKKVFECDPTNDAFISVSPKHQEWWKADTKK